MVLIAELRLKVEAACALRDSLDHYTTGAGYPVFLKRVMPTFVNILRQPCVLQTTTAEQINAQKLRNCVLEIFHRLPTSQVSPEPFEPYAEEVVDLLMHLVRNDNEDNAVLCIKVISDIMRHQHKIMGNKVQPFLSLIQELFEQLERIVREQLDSTSVPGPLGAPSTPSSTQTTFMPHQQSPKPGSPVATGAPDFNVNVEGGQQTNRTLLKGMQSFKVLAECPIIVVSIFQVYRSTVAQNVKAFVPLIKSALLCQAKAQDQAHKDAAARHTIHIGVSPNIKNRAAFGDFITAQVKTMSFLAYLLRQYSGQLTDFLPSLPEITVRLLRDCPREKSGARKELLVAIRHIINFNFRKIFLPKIDDLLDERTLIGDGLTVHETMRPLAYSMLADLIHHVRESLSPEQIRKTVEVYTRNLQDNFPGTSFQTMSAKLLLNMAEFIARMPNKVDARHYLIMILHAIADKFAAMNRQYPNAVKLSKLYAQQAADKSPETYLPDKEHPPEWDEVDIFNAMPIKASNPRDRVADPVVDNKFLFRNLMNGLKNTFYQLKSCNQPGAVDLTGAPAHWTDVAYGFTAEEVKVIIKLFREGAYVFRYYEMEKPASESPYSSPVEYMANFYMVSSSKEEKELLETFATVFHCIDPATFHEVFLQEIPRLYEMIHEHTALLHIPQFFLASEATSPSFCGMLLRFLMEHIEDVGSADIKRSSILLRLFKLAFMAVTLFASQNEQVLLPHVVDIVTKSIELSAKAEEPLNYFLLLRSLFRSIGGGKFEHLYKQILPLLEMLLDVLNNLLLAARKPAERDLYVELCLTVPARLSNLLPHLSFLMRPLVVALRANTDLVGQGLRTLELCVDNLTADYLDPIMAPVIDELMTALFDHLKPHPYNHFHAHTTLRILGKLGGRNRKFMTDALPVTFEQYADDRSSFDVRLIGSKRDRAFPAHLGIDLAIQKLMEVPKPSKGPTPPPSKQYDAYYKRQALNLIMSQVKLRVGFDTLPDDLPRLVRLQVQDLIAGNTDADIAPFEASDRERSIAKKNDEERLLKRLIKALLFAQSIPDFKAEVDALLLNLARHFTIIEVGRALVDMKKLKAPFDTKAGEGPLFVDNRVLSEAILESMASENPDVRDAAERLIKEMYDSAVTIFGSPTHVARLSLFDSLASTFCHGCYEEEWFTKAGGTLGIKALLQNFELGDSWLAGQHIEFVRALMYVIKDMPQDLPEKTRRSAQVTLELLLTRLAKNTQKSDWLPPPAPGPAQAPGPAPPPTEKEFRRPQIVVMLNGELSHMNRHVRNTAKRSLELIAKSAGAEVWELLEPHRKHVLQPIYAKPLRALPFAIQIGFIDAVTYYMSLKRDFVAFDENLNRLLMESLALADASDESLAGKTLEFRTHDFIVNLRVSCIRILSCAMGFDEFGSGPNNPTRIKVVSVFFKCLYSDSRPTIEAANDALKAVLQHTSKLPKDLLQSGLRPVLGSLQDPKRLTVQSLENLGRLLRLLTTYFKVEIGTRLLDHVKSIAEPNFLQQVSFTFFEQHNSLKVIAAVFNIFHLLPEAAKQFKERVIDNVLDLERQLRRTHHSPFRLPLYKYLNKFPSDVWAFILGKLEELRYGRFMAQVLRHQDSQVLRDYGAANVEVIIKTCNNLVSRGEEAKYIAVINTINMLDALCQFPNTLSWLDNKEHIDWLKQVGKELERNLRMNTLAPSLRLPAYQASEQLMNILVEALARNPQDLEPLFGLVESVTADEFRETPVLLSHIYKHIICSDSIEFWRTVVLRCLEIYAGKSASQRTKWYLLHNIVNPIVAMDVMRHWNRGEQNKGQRFLDKTVIDSINTKIWKVNLPDPQEDLLQPRIDHTRMEVLQLSAMLVKYHHAILQDARKDFIKFGWTYIRLDDVINKHAAYVVIGYFIAHYETPAKIVTQIYFSLLKTNQNEGRSLVTQALELMAPVMPKRCNAPLTDRNPIWAVAPRRILAEESQNVQQMTCIFHFLVRHPDLFYHTRDKFAMLIIQCLRKVASPPNPSNESRKLALNMMWLIWQWEQRRVEGKVSEPLRAPSESPNTKKRKLEETPQGSSPAAVRQPEKPEFQIPPMGRHKMIKYLVEFIAQLNERYPLPSAKPRDPATPMLPMTSPELCKKALTLLYNLLQPQYWGDLDVDLFPNVTDVVLASEKSAALLTADPSDTDKYDDKFITNIINTLQVVRIILNFKSDEWILKNMGQIQKILEKCLRSENPEIQDCLHMADRKYDGDRDIKPIVKRILDAVPEDLPMEDADADGEAEAQTSEIIMFLSSIATESMAASNYVSGINILWSLGRRKPSTIDQHIPAIMKSLQSKLARDHVSHYAALAHQASGVRPQQDPNAPTEMNAYDLEIQTGLILKAIEVTVMRMEILGDNRRPFLSVLATIVEKSLHLTLGEKILEIVEGWVFRSEGTWPTLKEKTAVLHKMISFEHRQDPAMLMKFLDLVLRIYEDPKIMRTELTVRMEHAFLIGTRAQDVEMRNKFMAIFDRSLPKTASARLAYVLLSQNWDTLADSYWLAQASQLLLGGVDMHPIIQLHPEDFRVPQISQLFGIYSKDTREPANMSDDKYESFMANHRRFVAELGDIRVRDILEPLTQLQHIDPSFAHELWVALFPMFWSATAKEDRPELERGMVTLLTKDYHSRQMDKRPNVVQSLVTGAVKTWPHCKIPPHVLKFEAKIYDVWYPALCQLENAALKPEIDSAAVRESNLDALVDLYASLGEDDLFYGTWRRRCQFVETNAALSYEQHGMWEKAQRMYETAQIKARTGVIPFSESEYMLWEDHWVLCAQKLQQWEILQDFAKHENFQDLLLECAWRNPEYWQNQDNREQLDTLIKGVMDAPTPRRCFFQAFMSLLKLHNKQETMQDFNRVVDEAIQLSIRKWHQLPKRLTSAHVPLLQNFQQLVELHDASVICQSLASTNASNLDVKSGELKLLLGSWRDRLPNMWDDIVSWQDLVTWRQHIFGLINGTYLQLLPQQPQNTGGASFAYRGYHETAWIINRFAHVARKHALPDVCISQLSRIYTLPNIEIQEAFLKLREQARCHYQNPEELSSGLDVINNTNLNYFSAPQKAEFYTLKGMFLEKLGQKDEADSAYGTALYFDITAAKAWAEWGYFNDRKFKENPADLGAAKQALTSYLQAASSYKNHKSRKLIARILWLLSLDDANGTIAAGFDDFKGEIAVWWWITYIPQLLVGLGYKEGPRVQNILLKIAKTQEKERGRRAQAAAANKPNGSPHLPKKESAAGGADSRPATANGEASGQAKPEPKAEGENAGAPVTNAAAQGEQSRGATAQKKPPWELTEEIMSVLKTAFPLLALSMETMVDQIQKHFKCPPDEDAYRLIVALLNDGLAYVSRMPTSYAKDVKLPAATENNITRFAETILPSHIRGTFEADFVEVKPTMYEYIHNLRKWRDKFEEKLDRRPSPVPLESFAHFSPHLSEFRYQKFDDVEIPGQYLQHKDKNQDFVRIDRFLPNVDLVRTIGASHRRLRIRGHDGSVHAFAVQHPAARHCRREERILQLFRQLNQTLAHKKESRRRDLQFTLPLMVPLAPHIRIVQDDPSYITLQGVYEDHCRRHGVSKDEPVLYTMEKLRGLADVKVAKPAEHAVTTRLEVLRAIQEKFVDNTVVLEYFQLVFPDFSEFWLFRRRFSYQLAALTFMTYILHIDKRYPHKMNIARRSGNIWGSELISFMAANRPYFHNQEPVPFRLTPNLQTLMGPLATEGIFACSVMAIARCLAEPEQQLEHALTLFVRDEMMYWFTSSSRAMTLTENQLRETVQANSDMIVKKAVSLAQAPAGNLPAHQTVIDLVAKAVNPMNLALCDALWMPYL
ncbi:TRA1-like protein [Thermothielavioides terrestris NRRL 8126]|uniref:TRA1-like protein n=1 Tax=Thermothielavioides terrestris (strain ATCC 38088 / NRRL 8126) TaxID=578455 RepID=G2QTC9_THETT|nr:TRA1-like protein [Thermothielavioides terrestris NRRL 8126]AEO62746.1 TRA1-like protein [Thermothielavioides terrestris NRRL 8126]